MNLISSFSVLLTLISLVVYYLVPAGRQWIVLLSASALYFGLCSPIGAAVMAACSLVSFFLAKAIARRPKLLERRILLCLSILLYVAAWVLVKVFSGSSGTGIFLFSTLRVSDTATALGCSYFVLRYIGYTADVYTHKCEPEKNYGKLLLFYLYFPAILQGPIERYGSFEKKLFPTDKIRPTYENIRQAGILILHGLFKVYVISRFCALYSQYLNEPEEKNALFLILAAFLYSFQIYADFSGSIDIVRGVSFLFGVELSENFRLPYLSQNFSEFWKRWHITFSSWLKDYIYIPLGGSRRGTLRIYLNLLIVFAVSGVWHGFSWTFLIWGLLQAVYQIIERIFRKKNRANANKKNTSLALYLLNALKVFLLSTFAWIFFNAKSLSSVGHLFSAVFSSLKTLPAIGLHDFLWDALVCFHDYSKKLTDYAFVFYLMLLAAMVLYAVVKDRFDFEITDPKRVNVGFRWIYYIALLAIVLAFGFYGNTFNLQSFIYGAF